MENEKKGTAPKKQIDKKNVNIDKVLPVQAPPEVVKLTLEEKLLKVQKMSDLVFKRKKLNEAILKLDAFCFSDDSLNTQLIITSGKSYQEQEFKTSNTFIIDDITEILKVKVFEKLHRIEAEIEELV